MKSKERLAKLGLCFRCGAKPNGGTRGSWCADCKAFLAQYRRNRYGVKMGDRCECCGEDNPLFLTLDHIDGKPTGSPGKMHGGLAIRIDVFLGRGGPTRALCYNCNCGRERNGGVCPHLAGSSRCAVDLFGLIEAGLS